MRVARIHPIASTFAFAILCTLFLNIGCARKTGRAPIPLAPSASAATPFIHTGSLEAKPDFSVANAMVAKGSGGTAKATAQATVSQPVATATPAQAKTIRDPAEFAAYKNTTDISDPEQRGDAAMQFVTQYPNTILKEDVLEGAMASYQQARDSAKMQACASQLLQVNPQNLRGLALLAYTKLQAGKQAYSSGQQAVAAGPFGEAAQYGQKGLQALQTAPNDPDTQKLKAAVTPIFKEAIGMNALNARNYVEAQNYLHAAVEAMDTNAPLELVYELATAYLQPTPPNAISGSWFGARAINLAQPSQQLGIKKYVLFYYNKYHGSTDGFDDILNQTKTAALPPAGFTIAPAPPPPSKAELAQKALANSKVEELGFEDWLFILDSGYQAGADQVWNYLKDKRTDIQGNVISATSTEIVLSATDDAKTTHKPDVTLKLRKPLPASRVPASGTVVDYDATFASYTTNPLTVIMDDAMVHGAAHSAAVVPKKLHGK